MGPCVVCPSNLRIGRDGKWGEEKEEAETMSFLEEARTVEPDPASFSLPELGPPGRIEEFFAALEETIDVSSDCGRGLDGSCSEVCESR